MKLTKKQQEVVDKFMELEEKHGKGNIFIRYINDSWKAMFVVHKTDSDKIDITFKDEYKVNGKVLNSLQSAGMIECRDIHHKKVEDPNVAFRNGVVIVGSIILI